MSKKSALIGAALAGVMSVAGAAQIEFVVGGKAYPGTLNDTGAAQALMERLPVDLKFEDFGSNERIAYFRSQARPTTALPSPVRSPSTSPGGISASSACPSALRLTSSFSGRSRPKRLTPS